MFAVTRGKVPNVMRSPDCSHHLLEVQVTVDNTQTTHVQPWPMLPLPPQQKPLHYLAHHFRCCRSSLGDAVDNQFCIFPCPHRLFGMHTHHCQQQHVVEFMRWRFLFGVDYSGTLFGLPAVQIPTNTSLIHPLCGGWCQDSR